MLLRLVAWRDPALPDLPAAIEAQFAALEAARWRDEPPMELELAEVEHYEAADETPDAPPPDAGLSPAIEAQFAALEAARRAAEPPIELDLAEAERRAASLEEEHLDAAAHIALLAEVTPSVTRILAALDLSAALDDLLAALRRLGLLPLDPTSPGTASRATAHGPPGRAQRRRRRSAAAVSAARPARKEAGPCPPPSPRSAPTQRASSSAATRSASRAARRRSSSRASVTDCATRPPTPTSSTAA